MTEYICIALSHLCLFTKQKKSFAGYYNWQSEHFFQTYKRPVIENRKSCACFLYIIFVWNMCKNHVLKNMCMSVGFPGKMLCKILILFEYLLARIIRRHLVIVTREENLHRKIKKSCAGFLYISFGHDSYKRPVIFQIQHWQSTCVSQGTS